MENEFFPMNTSKSAQSPQQSGEAASSMIPSTQIELEVRLAQQHEGPSCIISSSQAESQAGQQEFREQSSRFQGVFYLQNSHWGAQINTISLGLFKSEVAAARAYDSASLKLFGNNFMRNLFLTSVTIHESLFQNMYSLEVIINMIKDRSYEPNYINFLWNHYPNFRYGDSLAMPTSMYAIDGTFSKEIFRKELLLTDIQNQNLIVIPDLALLSFHPKNSNTGKRWFDFKDRTNRSWAFQLDYVNTTPDCAFTTGWNKFFNEMELCANDTVVFYRCKNLQNFPDEFFNMIDVIRGIRKPESRDGIEPH
ncbi:AP2/ERF and B3 domain-containing transcription factor At1g51120-like [Phalaenopsis equestris]|uniref:AP2/ERF and B3 domain-containing transcription factor At1g51120-like n=1 Tax=Phalaenopsis equestris TaxID=78828 RepID=UPI0009E50898|nr:AP2/ERF and B3 domain-containing transcription factor At1g51120-like [Phalaenopsis equestris]XP_020585857.1 AP2/ERF and B3 domain-containing transcription factor At1g51120-like [Phalaenopsis equestris]